MQDINGVLPGIELGSVEFAEVEDLALDNAITTDAQTFANGIVSVRLAVFGAGAVFEKHSAANLPRSGGGKTRGWVGTRTFSPMRGLSFIDLHPKKSEIRHSVRKSG